MELIIVQYADEPSTAIMMKPIAVAEILNLVGMARNATRTYAINPINAMKPPREPLLMFIWTNSASANSENRRFHAGMEGRRKYTATGIVHTRRRAKSFAS